MKNKLLKIILGISVLVFFGLAITSDYLFNREDSLQQSAKRIQQVFAEKKPYLNKDLKELSNAIENKNGGLQEYDNFTEFEYDLRKDGFVLLAFKADSLIFWSDNAFIVPDPEVLKNSNGTVKCFENGWYYIQTQQQDSVNLFALLLIKKIYPYQNKFLKNHFEKEFDIPAEYDISLNRNKGAPIFDEAGNYLFSLENNVYGFSTLKYQNRIGVFYGIFILLLLLFISVQILEIRNVKIGLFALFIWGIFLLCIRYLMIQYAFPSVFSNLEIFSPVLFARSFLFPSLGDFLLNVLFLYIFIYSYTAYGCKYYILKGISKIGASVLLVLYILIYWLLYYWVSTLVSSLVLDSSFSLQMFVFQDNGFYVFIGFLILLLLMFSLGHYAYFIAEICRSRWSLKKYLLYTLVVSIPVIIYFLITTYKTNDYLFLILPLIILLFIGIACYKTEKGSYYSLIIILLLIVAFALTNRINVLSHKKEAQDRMVAAMNLSTEYDPTSENLLVHMQKNIDSDNLLKQLCQNPFRNEQRIMEYIRTKYFSGFWEQYYLQITICNNSDDLSIEPDNEVRNCFEFFEEMILETGEAIPNTKFYYLNEFDGMVSYLGKFEYQTEHMNDVRIFIRLDSKIGSEGIGYPDLLLDEKLALRQRGKDYSYGKYRNGKLIASSGDFKYYMNVKIFGDQTEKTFNVDLDDYDHLVYKFNNNAVVVSFPAISWYNKLITVPYLFVFLYMFGVSILLLSKFPWRFKFNMSFKYRIQYSIIGLLMLFFLLLGGGTVYYTIERTKEVNNRSLEEKLQIVKQEVNASLGENLNNEFITERLRRLSSLIYADIHLYDSAGELITSSRKEIFDKKLQYNKMNFAAYYQLFFKEKTSFIHKEKIGTMSYLSAYETIVDENNKIVAFVNLPYFLKSQDLEREMFNLILAGVNLHVFMILLAIFLSVFISNKITYPLRIIQNRIKATRFGSYGEKIEYSKDDEIGGLVKEYNQMLLELGESAEKLAQSERESAWREMARQIAHEIKNPLTPMKLSIQFLQKRFEDKSENREEHLQQVSKTLIEQINTLSSIATAFSNFAKMPTANNEMLNLVDILNHVMSLFRNDHLDLKLELNNLETAMVFVDKEQFIRVFVNLINNAIQSIPDGRLGQIIVELEDDDDYFKACVIDNGNGINDQTKEKLFYPNFTTKSGGMGLGLAIVKNIIKNAKGEIWVDSELGVGSCFNIRIPKYKQD